MPCTGSLRRSPEGGSPTWFEQQSLRITDVDSNHLRTERTVRHRAVVMDRYETRLDGRDLEKDERRSSRIDRITRAMLVESAIGLRPMPEHLHVAPRTHAGLDTTDVGQLISIASAGRRS